MQAVLVVFRVFCRHLEFSADWESWSENDRMEGRVNNGDDRPTQLLSTCFSQLRVWLERVYLLRICPFCMKLSGDLEIFRLVAVVAGLNAIFA